MIKAHAGFSSWEIYGWMIGYEGKDDDLYVLSVIPCDRYDIQHKVGAAPDPTDVQEISKSLPIGMGIVGFYHSHPDEVFHSATDDGTLENLSKHYPHMISAVTNGKITKWFMYNSRVEDAKSGAKILAKHSVIAPKMIHMDEKQVRFVPVVTNAKIALKLSSSISISPQLSRIITDNYADMFESARYEILDMPGIMVRIHDKQRLLSFDFFGGEYKSAGILQRGRLMDIAAEFSGIAFKDASYLRVILENKAEVLDTESPTCYVINTEKLLLIKAPNLKIDAAVIVKRLKIEIMESLLTKIGQSVDITTHKGENPRLLMPDSVFLKYPSTPVRISLWLRELQDIPKTRKTERINEIEKKRLDSWKNKFATLARTDFYSDGIRLLRDLEYLSSLRGDQRQRDKINTLIELIEGIKK